MEDAAIVGVQTAFVKKQTLLHCAISQLLSNLSHGGILGRYGDHTSLEAVDWRRDLNSTGEQIWERWKHYRERETQGGSSAKEHNSGLIMVDLRDDFHIGGRVVLMLASRRGYVDHASNCKRVVSQLAREPQLTRGGQGGGLPASFRKSRGQSKPTRMCDD